MSFPETSPPRCRTSKAQQLVERASAPLFACPEGIAYAQIDLGSGAAQSVALRSFRFRDWLLARFYREYGIVPAVNAVSQAKSMFEANAHCAQDRKPQPQITRSRVLLPLRKPRPQPNQQLSENQER